jgi:hypothetical protein
MRFLPAEGLLEAQAMFNKYLLEETRNHSDGYEEG